MTRSGDREFVRWNFRELEENLPRPGRMWTWEECGLEFGILMKLMDRSLIIRASGVEEWKTTEWETTERCWSLLIEIVGTSDEGVGDAVGQERLLARREFPRENQTRVLESSQSNTTGRPQQLTLTGDEVEVGTVGQGRDIDWIHKCREAGQLGDPEVREERQRERDPAQTSLVEWTQWEVTVRDEQSVTRPSGAVY